MIQDRTIGSKVFDGFNYVILVFLGLFCVLPFIHLLAISVSDRASTLANLVTFWPINFTSLNYQKILEDLAFRRAFLVSLVRVILGTSINLLIVILTAYPLSLAEGFIGKSFFKWILIFAMLFSGGLIPWYLAIRSLGLINSIWALILPGMVQMWNIIIMLNFFRSLPAELGEAATVDGASHWDILFRIYVPLSLPALATVTLFAAVGHWNSWFDALVVMRTPDNYPLQAYLQTTVLARMTQNLIRDPEAFAKLSERSMRAAQIIIATIPILMVYPFLQRYFVHGLTLGSVKG
ncbi:MAG: carbohydrate ABC transporter permease [Chloroflexi bacterium]|nr:carbohydrate ABC transporter permease [Chloroflexota bacterium]